MVELGLITKEKIKHVSIITSLALFLPMLTAIPLTVFFYTGVSGFLDGFIQLAGIYLIAGLFDRIFLGGGFRGHFFRGHFFGLGGRSFRGILLNGGHNFLFGNFFLRHNRYLIV